MAKIGRNIDLPISSDLRLGNFKQVLSNVVDNSIDVIITDPPYPREFLGCWDDLSDFASRKLKPSGYLIAYSGQMHLPKVMKRLSKNLNLVYKWLLCLHHQGPQTQIVNNVSYRCEWKPILVYQKAPRVTVSNGEFKSDFIEGGKREKSLHEWQQSAGGFERLIEDYSKEGDLICDPFAGIGTVPKLCREMNRNFVGAEIVVETYNIAKANIDNVISTKNKSNKSDTQEGFDARTKIAKPNYKAPYKMKKVS